MQIVCLDLEGVLVPEIWIAFSGATGIKELSLTTRDISDYDILMQKRISLLKANNLKLPDTLEIRVESYQWHEYGGPWKATIRGSFSLPTPSSHSIHWSSLMAGSQVVTAAALPTTAH